MHLNHHLYLSCPVLSLSNGCDLSIVESPPLRSSADAFCSPYPFVSLLDAVCVSSLPRSCALELSWPFSDVVGEDTSIRRSAVDLSSPLFRPFSGCIVGEDTALSEEAMGPFGLNLLLLKLKIEN